jgi:tetratricopeptide (TPR) repeat protein
VKALRILVYSALFVAAVVVLYGRYQRSAEAPPQETASDDAPTDADGAAPLLDENGDLLTASGSDETSARAVQEFKAGRYEEAIKTFQSFSDRDKTAFTGIGLSYYMLKNYRSSIDYLETSIKENGESFLARKYLAFSYYNTDDMGGSLKNARAAKAIRKDEDVERLLVKLGREKKTQENFEEKGSLHFKILFEGGKHDAVTDTVVDILDEAYAEIGGELGHFPKDTVTVILYTDKDFRAATKTARWSHGLYDGKIRIPIKGVAGQDAILRRVLFHEFTHALIHSITPTCPTWLNEGLAEYFSKSTLLKTGQTIPLNRLEGSFLGLSTAQAESAYAESFSAASYLVETYGAYAVKDMLDALGGGGNVADAFATAFHITYKEFIDTWGRGGGGGQERR